jgi:hypothetical protein
MIVPASTPWVAMAEYDQLLQEAAERGRLARLADRRHRPVLHTRPAAHESRWAARPPRTHTTVGMSH